MAWAPGITGKTSLLKTPHPTRVRPPRPVCPNCDGEPLVSLAKFTNGPKSRLECRCGVVGEYRVVVYRHDPWDDALNGWLRVWRRASGTIQSWRVRSPVEWR